MRGYRILTPTLGHVERIQIAQRSGLPTAVFLLIEWRWWCRGWLRLVWVRRAVVEAAAVLKAELPEVPKSELVVGRWLDEDERLEDPQGFAVRVSVSLGYGLPEEWRRARYRDVIHALRFRAWQHEKREERGEAPAW